MHYIKKLALFPIITLLAATASFAEDIAIKTSFIPKEMPAGHTGTYLISITGTNATPKIQLPNIPELHQTYRSSQTSVQYINGKSFVQSDYTFNVSAKTPGLYTIPEFTVIIKEKAYTAPSASINITPAPDFNGDTQAEAGLKLEVPEGNLYVGQMIPATIHLYVADTVHGQLMEPFPTKDGDSFADHDFKEQPTRTVTTVNNVPFQRFSWKTFVTPLKSGTHELDYRININIIKPSALPTRRSIYDSFFDDVNNALLAQQQTVTLHTPNDDLNIRALPKNELNYPFNGAIGKFSLHSIGLSENEAEIGEPITLKVAITGSGNFDRLSPPKLLNTDKWKTYTPKASFTPQDPYGFSGTKTFEYVVIPLSNELTEAPTFSMVAFNPEQESYYELVGDTLPVKITGSAVATTSIHSEKEKPHIPTFEPKKLELTPIALLMDTPIFPSISPLISKPWFLAMQFAPLAALYLIYQGRRKQLLLENDSAYARKVKSEKAFARDIHEMRKAHSKKDFQKFYHASQRAICELLSRYINCEGKSLTLAEISDFLDNHNIHESLKNSISEVFEAADLIKFSGSKKIHSPSHKPQQVEELIQALESCLTKKL